MTHLRCRRSSEVRRMRFRACCDDVVEEEDEVEEEPMVVVVCPLSSLPVRIMWWEWGTEPGGPPMIMETPPQSGGMLPRLETPVASWRGIGGM